MFTNLSPDVHTFRYLKVGEERNLLPKQRMQQEQYKMSLTLVKERQATGCDIHHHTKANILKTKANLSRFQSNKRHKNTVTDQLKNFKTNKIYKNLSNHNHPNSSIMLSTIWHVYTTRSTEQCKEIGYTDALQSVHTRIVFSQAGSRLQQALWFVPQSTII